MYFFSFFDREMQLNEKKNTKGHWNHLIGRMIK